MVPLSLFSLSLLAALTIVADARQTPSAAADEVVALPGFTGALPSKWYSGLLPLAADGATGRRMWSHYMYVERVASPRAASPAPLLLWSNGGPGASSMFGLLTEIGPLVFTGKSLKSGVPQLVENLHSWSRDADILIFDAPPPIGFSFCDPPGPGGPGTSCGDWDDARTTRTNVLALKAFFQRFPALQARDLYLSGESYAGVYIPSLARAILEAQDGGDPLLSKVNLRGFAVGDACVGTDVLCGDAGGPFFDVEFLGGHHQFSRELYDKIYATCGVVPLKTGTGITAACQALLSEMHRQVGGYYEYALYDECTYTNPFTQRLLRRFGATPGYHRWRGGQEGLAPAIKGALNDYACGTGQALFAWVDLPEVRKALNVPIDSNWFCADNGLGFVYKVTEKNLMPFYIDVAVGKFASRGLRVLVYNGDVDPSINSLAAQNWTSALGLAVTRDWRPWTTDWCRKMGGYVTEFEGKFAFLTIRGAGHMVPQYKPVAAAAFMRAWLRNEPYPSFNASCTSPPKFGRGAWEVDRGENSELMGILE